MLDKDGLRAHCQVCGARFGRDAERSPNRIAYCVACADICRRLGAGGVRECWPRLLPPAEREARDRRIAAHAGRVAGELERLAKGVDRAV